MNEKIRILVVEDESDINKLLCSILENEGYATTSAFSGSESLMCIKDKAFDLILLDLMIPGISGEEAIIKIRELSKVPIIVISAKKNKKVKIELLEKGADDFICKPFDPDEVIARVKSNLRRYIEFSDIKKDESRNLLKYKEITLNKESKEIKLEGKPVMLTAREYKILELLMTNPNKVFSKANIFESVWEEEYLSSDNTINVHVSRIRNKLSAINNKDYIETIWSMGYKMKK